MKQIKSPGETIESHGGNENFNFVQLSRSYLHQMRKLARKSPIAHEILYYLVEHMGRTTNAVVCSYTTLCEITGVSRPTVGRAIKLLKDDQWIDTVKIGNANAYCVNERCSGKLEEIKKIRDLLSNSYRICHRSGERFQEKAKQKLTYIPIIESSDIPTTGTDELPPPDQGDLSLE